MGTSTPFAPDPPSTPRGATPNRSRLERCIPAAQLIRSGPRCFRGDGLSASLDTWLHLGSAALLARYARFGRMSPSFSRCTGAGLSAQEVDCAPREARRMPQYCGVRAGRRSPRGYIHRPRPPLVLVCNQSLLCYAEALKRDRKKNVALYTRSTKAYGSTMCTNYSRNEPGPQMPDLFPSVPNSRFRIGFDIRSALLKSTGTDVDR